jgi:LmbE family N-acetylglucosaminyl deacetylase
MPASKPLYRNLISPAPQAPPKMPKQNSEVTSENQGTISQILKFLNEYASVIFIFFALVSIVFLVRNYINFGDNLPENISIVLSPHFDDGVLSLGGFMAEQKNPIVVATFFAGNPQNPIQGGWDTLSGFKDSAEAIATRTKENALALKQLGTYPLNLGYTDFQYRFDRTPDSETKIQKSVENDIDTIIQKFSDSKKVSIYGPAEFGQNITHPDHKILHDAFTAIAKKNLGRKNLHFFYFEDFPYVYKYGISTTTPLIKLLENNNQDIFLKEIAIPISNEALTKKIEGIEAYGSQYKAFGSFGEDISSDAKIFNKKRCVQNIAPQNICEVVYEILPSNRN